MSMKKVNTAALYRVLASRFLEFGIQYLEQPAVLAPGEMHYVYDLGLPVNDIVKLVESGEFFTEEVEK